MQRVFAPLQRPSRKFRPAELEIGGRRSDPYIDKHVNLRCYPHAEAAVAEVISSTSTLSFDPIGVFFWPTYWVDPSTFGLFALVKCVQWHVPLMCEYWLDRYKTLGWPIAYWSGGAVWILPRLQVYKTRFAMQSWVKAEIVNENNRRKRSGLDAT